MQFDLARGTAAMRVANMAVPDHHTIPNSFSGDTNPPVAATVSFDIRWTGTTRRVPMRDEKEGFVGDFMETAATAEWSARQAGFEFTSDPAPTSRSLFALVGAERNGSFFRGAALPRTGGAGGLTRGALPLGAALALAGLALRRRG